MIVDAHCHIMPPSFAERRPELAQRDATFAAILASPKARIADVSALLRAMDRDGVDHAVVMGMGWQDRQVAIEANDYIIEAVSSHSDRITGFASVNPAWGDEAVKEAERCAAAGLRGIGELHPDSQGFDISDAAAMAPLMSLALCQAMPMLIHCSEPVGHLYPGKGQTTPDKVLPFINNFPDNLIICAHWGGGLPFYALMPEVGAALRNVYFDSAASPFLYRPGIYRAVAEIVGPERILFASDYPLMRPSRPMAELAAESLTASQLTESHRRGILGENAARLLGLAAGEGR